MKRKAMVKAILIKTVKVLVVMAVAFGAFVLLMAYIIACGVAAGLGPLQY